MLASAAMASAILMTGGPALAAPAQAAVCDANAYPPTGPQIEPGLKVDGSQSNLAHGGGGSVTLTGAASGGTYSGTVFSQAVPLPSAVADSSGFVRFQGVSVPNDFQLGAVHEIQIIRDGCLVGDFSVCVTTAGAVVAPGSCPAAPAAAVGASQGARRGRGREGRRRACPTRGSATCSSSSGWPSSPARWACSCSTPGVAAPRRSPAPDGPRRSDHRGWAGAKLPPRSHDDPPWDSLCL